MDRFWKGLHVKGSKPFVKPAIKTVVHDLDAQTRGAIVDEWHAAHPDEADEHVRKLSDALYSALFKK